MLILLGSFLLLMLFGAAGRAGDGGRRRCSTSWSTGIAPDVIVAQRMIAGVESFPLLAVPFFILAGNLMNIAGVTGRIYNFAVALVGWMKGGLGQVNIIGSVIFSGMSGTAIADAAGLGTIEIKAMKDHGYSTEFAVGVTAASATLGPIIPPSLPFVIYGMMANVSIGALFLGGMIPGVVMTLLMMATVAYLRPQERLGQRHALLLAAARRGHRSRSRSCWPSRSAIWLMMQAGLSPNVADRHCARRAARARLVLRLLGRDGADGAGHPDRRHDAWAVHADRGGGRRGDLVAVPRARALPLDDPEDARQGHLRHHRDHGLRAVHRHRGVDLRLAADGQPGRADPLATRSSASRRTSGCSCCWRTS